MDVPLRGGAGHYQVRAWTSPTSELIEGDTGVLSSSANHAAARAALALYRKHRGDRPVVGVLYSHSHADHFGGVKGVTTQAEVDAGTCTVIAPDGFVEHAVSENVYAGAAMARRAGYMYGAARSRPQGPDRGRPGPNHLDRHRHAHHPHRHHHRDRRDPHARWHQDGVPADAGYRGTIGDERPVPRSRRLVHGRECHPHPAQPADPAWCGRARPSRLGTLPTAIIVGGRFETVFASHHWPTWGADRAVTFLDQQRDLYAYLHDQTLRMLNAGLTGIEIVEAIELPPVLERAWHARAAT